MTRINRPDTLLTELRDIKRRLRLLEAGRMRPPAAAALAAPAGQPVPLPPVRPIDWPATESAGWERLFAAPSPGPGTIVELRLAADPDTTGEARVLLDGEPMGQPVPVRDTPVTHQVEVGAGTELTVEVRRSEGTGLVRATALLRP
jgi:hypothetical protein